MLKIKNLCKKFGEKVIFEDFNFQANKGEFVTILGGNGAGKSTLFNLISGTLFPDSGEILIDGIDVSFMPEHKRAKFIGRVFQDPLKGSSPNLTVEENIALAASKNVKNNLRLATNRQNSELFKEKLSPLNLGMENRFNDKAGDLSGGQRQVLAIFMAMICQPKILLLDEHTAALDPKSQEKILDLTEKITQNTEITTLMITHNMTIVERFNENVVTLG
ncbi:MAG: ATP-binding cassette domain-containing protein [Oscillospiraceae bacterium]|jgi:putative ABC transport system ATP-binding protein|nr:ATP-binding cassette domain-containing protein [Oscillospiraceae bacterium]